MEILRNLHVMNGEMKTEIGQAFGLAPVETKESKSGNAHPLGHLKGPENVRGIPASGVGQKKITLLPRGLQLFGKHIFVPCVVSQAS